MRIDWILPGRRRGRPDARHGHPSPSDHRAGRQLDGEGRALRVVVIGAGFAGLAAADALWRGGADVIVLEARDRVGGRVWSHALPSGAIVEMGAEFILPGDDTIRDIAVRLGLELFEKGATYGDRAPRGGIGVTRAELLAAQAAVLAAGRAGRLGQGSVVDALDALPIPPGAREAIRARVEVSTAYPAEDQASSVLAEAGTEAGRFATHSITGGNQRLASALASGLPTPVVLRTPVDRVAWSVEGDDGPMAGVHAGGADLAADAVIVAVPASVIDRISFDPPLPAPKAAALAAVRYGQAAKLFLPLDRPAPPSAVLSVPDRFWTFTQLDPTGAPLPVAGSFAGSPVALSRLAVASGPATWIGAVRRLRPDLELRESDAVLSTWADDPWVGAAYSARSRSSPMDDAALAAPVGPVHFAGEHTAGARHALMDGALASGIRAAGEILPEIAEAGARIAG